MCERLLRQSFCLHSQSPPQKLCVDDESLDLLVLVRTGAAMNEGASQPRRNFRSGDCECKQTLCLSRRSRIHYNDYRLGVLDAQSKIKSQRDSNDNLLVYSLKVWQLTKQNKMLHRVQNNVTQSNRIQYFRHVIAYNYFPLLYLSHKRRT